MFFIDVILPIPLRQTFTYSVNKHEAAFLKKGMRVAVPFGKSKIYTAIVYHIHSHAPINYQAKPIDHIIEEEAVITQIQMKFWEWMAAYYMSTLGEMIKTALPNTFLLESETILSLTETKTDDLNLSDDELEIYHLLQHQSTIHIDKIKELTGKKNIVGTVKKLIEKGIVEIEETLYEKYVPKLKKYIRLNEEYNSQEKMQMLLDKLSKAPKQKEVLMHYFSRISKSKKPVGLIELQEITKVSDSVIKGLLDKNIFEIYYIQQDRVSFEQEEAVEVATLNDAQNETLKSIHESFKAKEVVLLHGVTSSGKTEVYVNLIKEVIEEGKQVLFMLPEIALTTQLIQRLQKYFGNKISVYHSKYSLNERTEVWNNLLNEKSNTQIIIGARSSLFLPFKNLGLIIVDEEHETSYKQFDPSPRYHARDSAIMLAHFHRAKVLLGSATPSLESYHNAITNRYGLAILKKRYGNVPMPEIQLVDIREKIKKKSMIGNFSDVLLKEIKITLEQGEQVILFQNRRGFSPMVECATCGTAPQCPNCDVSLTYHKGSNQLRCHYCGYNMAMIKHCAACGSTALNTKGLGTEQIENELRELFPEHKTARMDQDTTRGKHAYSKLLDALANEEIDILVGTQMLAKGLDFRKIGLVGVMNADNLLHFPDFRAHERSYQLLSQVAGRAGRTNKRGKVIIQTYNPLHRILYQVVHNDYEAMFNEQLLEREKFKYPPFYRIIHFEFKDRNLIKVEKAAHWFAQSLEKSFAENILGPAQPPVSRIRNQYIYSVLLKIPKNQNLQATKQHINKLLNYFNTIREFASVRINVDVDMQ